MDLTWLRRYKCRKSCPNWLKLQLKTLATDELATQWAKPIWLHALLTLPWCDRSPSLGTFMPILDFKTSMIVKETIPCDGCHFWWVRSFISNDAPSWELMMQFLNSASQELCTRFQTPRKLFGFYQTKEGFWPDCADFKHDYTLVTVLPVLLIFYQLFFSFTGPIHFPSANVWGTVSFAVSVVHSLSWFVVVCYWSIWPPAF